MANYTLKYPKDTTITGRSSTMRGSFIKAVIPIIPGTKEEQESCLKRLKQNIEKLFCCYCGDKATEWDHFRAIVSDKGPSGYVTDVYNLVPSCAKCNQSKGGKKWNEWMTSNAPNSPKTRKIEDLAARMKVLKSFETWSDKHVKRIPREFIEGEVFVKYMESCEKFIKSLKKYQIQADAIKVELENC